MAQAIRQVFREPQGDPELKRLRRAARRGRWPYVLWLYGFPALVFGVTALLILSGLIRRV